MAFQFSQLYQQHGHPPGFDEETTYRELMNIAMNKMSGIVATAVLHHTVTVSDDPWRDTSAYGWVLTDVIVLSEPIPCRGAQGLWSIPEELLYKFDVH